jgi:hypothetical protein
VNHVSLDKLIAAISPLPARGERSGYARQREIRVRGRVPEAELIDMLGLWTPTPDPSPQGGEERAASAAAGPNSGKFIAAVS